MTAPEILTIGFASLALVFALVSAWLARWIERRRRSEDMFFGENFPDGGPQ